MMIYNNPSKGEVVLFKGRKFYLDMFTPEAIPFTHKGKDYVSTHTFVEGNTLYLLVRNVNFAWLFTQNY